MSNTFDKIRNEIYRIYDNEYSKTESKKDALDMAKIFIEEAITFIHPRLAKSWKPGLITEISFYDEFRQKFKLVKASKNLDVNFKTDFLGIDPITKKKLCIDVTNNLQPKLSKMEKLKDVLGDLYSLNDKIGYRIVHYDIDSADNNLTPLMLPVNSEGNWGYYVLTLEQDGLHLMGYLSVIYLDSDNQIEDHELDIQAYCFDFQSDLDSIYTMVRDELYFERELNGLTESREFQDSNDDSSKIKRAVLQELSCSRQFFSKFVRNTAGTALSSIIEPREFYVKPRDELFYEYYSTWAHPVKQIKKIFGNILEEPNVGEINILYY